MIAAPRCKAALVHLRAVCYTNATQSLVWVVICLFARLSLPSVPVLALAGAMWAAPSSALELVPGGYGRAPDGAAAAAGTAGDERLEIGRGGDAAAGVSLGFTPRHAGGGLGVGEGDAAPEVLRFGPAVRVSAGALDRLGLAEAPSGTLHPGSGGGSVSGLTVGGAMQWHDWTFGGGLGHADFLGTELDLYSATLGYGRLNAEIAYGQSSDPQAPARDVLMLSTDLAASSWLTLESDLALGSRPTDAGREDEAVAVGRFGLRLNF